MFFRNNVICKEIFTGVFLPVVSYLFVILSTREGGYVSVKLQFHNADTDNVDQFIEFLRAGGGELLTDRVYIKLANIGQSNGHTGPHNLTHES